MNSLMEYKGYHAKIEYSAEDETFVGRVIGIRDYLLFDGNDINELIEMFHSTVDEYLKDCDLTGKEPDKEYKGSFNVRMSPETHRRAALVAQAENKTLNQLVCDAVGTYCDTMIMN